MVQHVDESRALEHSHKLVRALVDFALAQCQQEGQIPAGLAALMTQERISLPVLEQSGVVKNGRIDGRILKENARQFELSTSPASLRSV